MCMIEGCDTSNEFYKAVTYTARKTHVCDECQRVIEIGEKYEYVAAKSEGSMWFVWTCAHCVAVRAWIKEVCGGFVHNAVIEELQEHRAEGYNPRWLSIAIAGMERKWRDKEGHLWRLMKLPKNLSPLPA